MYQIKHSCYESNLTDQEFSEYFGAVDGECSGVVSVRSGSTEVNQVIIWGKPLPDKDISYAKALNQV